MCYNLDMKTITEALQECLQSSPYLEDMLAKGLINVSSLAREVKPAVEKQTMKKVGDSAVIMSLNRMIPSIQAKSNQLSHIGSIIADLTVRSHLVEYTFVNSQTISEKQLEFLHIIKDQPDIFYSQSQGVGETTILVSAAYEGKLKEIFASEKLKSSILDISSITIRLTQDTTDTAGIYYSLIKPLAWEGINIIELNSTNLELTFFFREKDVNKAFTILNAMLQ